MQTLSQIDEQSNSQKYNNIVNKVKLEDGKLVLVTLLELGSNVHVAALVDTNEVSVQAEFLSEMLELLAENFQIAAKAEEQIENVCTELAQTYEELMLLHKLSTNMKVTESDLNFLQMACDNLTEIITVEGISILLEKTVENEDQLFLVDGKGVIDIYDHWKKI